MNNGTIHGTGFPGHGGQLKHLLQDASIPIVAGVLQTALVQRQPFLHVGRANIANLGIRAVRPPGLELFDDRLDDAQGAVRLALVDGEGQDYS